MNIITGGGSCCYLNQLGLELWQIPLPSVHYNLLHIEHRGHQILYQSLLCILQNHHIVHIVPEHIVLEQPQQLSLSVVIHNLIPLKIFCRELINQRFAGRVDFQGVKG